MFGLDAVRRVAPPRVVESLIAVGVLIYAGTGVACMIRGGNFLEYGSLDPRHPTHGQHLGILLVELGVGIAVGAVMITVFYAFAARRRS